MKLDRRFVPFIDKTDESFKDYRLNSSTRGNQISCHLP